MTNSGTLLRRALLAGAALLALGLGARPDIQASAAGGKRVCVSWRHFQEERWRIDEAGIKSMLGPAGYTYVSADAQGDPQKQMTDVDSLLSSKCDAAIILAQDSKAILPAIAQAKAAGVPVVAYDAPIDSPDVLFVSFDNVAVGHLMAEAMVKARDSLIELELWNPPTDKGKQERGEHPLWRRFCDVMVRVEAARTEFEIYKQYNLFTQINELWQRIQQTEVRFRTAPPARPQQAA